MAGLRGFGNHATPNRTPGEVGVGGSEGLAFREIIGFKGFGVLRVCKVQGVWDSVGSVGLRGFGTPSTPNRTPGGVGGCGSEGLGLGFLGLRVLGLGVWVQRVWGSGFRVYEETADAIF